MYRASLSAFALSCTALFPVIAADPASIAPAPDPYLWLEEIEGPQALQWVAQENAATDALLKNRPNYEADRQRAFKILSDDRQIAMPAQIYGDNVTNFWRDAKNPRGIWRQASLASYLAGNPQWKTLIDIDALGKAEEQSWVWHGANCLAPEYRRCLISLSPGGTDSDVVREWDRSTGSFVDEADGGFALPQAKSNVSWLDANTLIIGTDFGENSMTSSGYPRTLRRWQRGTPLSSAPVVLAGEKADVRLSPLSITDKSRRWNFLVRAPSFYSNIYYLLAADGSRLNILDLPQSASLRAVLNGQAIFLLNAAHGDLPQGALASLNLRDVEAGRNPELILVMNPTPAQAIEQVEATDNILWVKALDDVEGKLFALTPPRGNGARGNNNAPWRQREIPLSQNATVEIAASIGKKDRIFATSETMLTPPSLYALGLSGRPRLVQSLPATFDAKHMTAEKRFATSKDGTKIPYFLVRKKGTTGPVPALIHGYGGFRAAQTPAYLTSQPYRAGPLGLFWVEEGNAYVLANLRGGGEYGPKWHEAALREKRQNSFDDLHAISEDLIRTGVSLPSKIAISGRSNGGVLVGAAMNQRPDLYGAVISGSPLKDMYRYNKLLAGASWMEEYGNPDDPKDWAYMSHWSPYQNIRMGISYPPIFLYLSTKDDRVHPGHARKFAARLKQYGNPVYYHEYLEGGHSVGADPAEDANRAALLHGFLQRELMEK